MLAVVGLITFSGANGAKRPLHKLFDVLPFASKPNSGHLVEEWSDCDLTCWFAFVVSEPASLQVSLFTGIAWIASRLVSSLHD